MAEAKPLSICALASVVVLSTAFGRVALAAEATGSGDATTAPSTGPEPRTGEPVPPGQTPPEPEEPQAIVVPQDAPSLQLSSDFVTPALAFSGYFPTSDIAGGRIRVGPVNVYARMHASLGYDDNIRLTISDKRGSFFTNLSPSLMLALERPEQRYYLLYRGSYSAYASESANNNQVHTVTVQALDDWTQRLRTNLRYDFLRGYDPRGSTDTASDRTQTWNMSMLRGSVAYGAPGAAGRLEGTARYTTRRYETDRATNAVLDYDQWEVGGMMGVRAAPLTYVNLQVTHAEVTHPRDPASDSTENRYLVGASWEATAKTRASGAVGYMTKNTESPNAPSFSGPTYDATVRWAPQTYTSVNVQARRTFAEPSEVGSRYVIVDFLSATWSHSWFERFRSSLGAIYGRQQHQGIDRTDNYYSVDARLTYALYPRVRLGAQLRHDVRNSPDPLLEYKRNLTLLTIETAL